HYRAKTALTLADSVLDWHHQTFGAIELVAPQLVVIEAPSEAADIDGLAIGRPRRRDQHGIVAAEAHLSRLRAIGTHHPHVLRARAGADEGEPVAVRRIGRLRIEPHAAGECCRAATSCVERKEIAKQIEHDALAV